MAIRLEVSGFAAGAPIPVRHTCDGSDLSPALSWSDPPQGTKSFVLIVDDPDAPIGTWNHWLLWDIPASRTSLPEGFEPGELGVSGRNDFGRRGYGGPCPPRGHGFHRYFFCLYALDQATLGLPENSNRKSVDNALQGHVLEQAEYIGKFERKK